MISFQVFYIFIPITDPLFKHQHQSEEERISNDNNDQNHIRAGTPNIPMKSPVFFGDNPAEKMEPATIVEMAKFGGILFIVYAAAVYFSSLSFYHTSVSSAVIMATTNGIFLLLFGLVFSTDQVTILKLIAVGISAAGAVTLAVSERNLGKWRLLGNMMSLGSSACFALYSIVLKKLSKRPSRVSTPLLFAILGTYSMLILWPLFFVLHTYEIERFVWPSDLLAWTSILFNVIFGSLVPTYLWTVGFVLASPMAVALGISLTVPITLVNDMLWSNDSVKIPAMVAGGLVVAGFLLINSKTLCGPSSSLDTAVCISCN